MDAEMPPQTPEGRLIEAAAKASGRSIRALAANAGISDTRWRHIVKGWQPTAAGPVKVRAPAGTLAEIALALGLTAEQLSGVGRQDAADLVVRRRDEAITVEVKRVHRSAASNAIDMIYQSQTMTSEEKLAAIRKVLELEAETEQGAPTNVEAPARPEPTNHV